jgi:hypothetical protein
MTPAFIWFTWGPDADCLRESVESVKAAAPDAPLHVRFDPDAPLPSALIWDLTAAGVVVRPSEGPHGGNLNGEAHVLRQLTEMVGTCILGVDWVVKVDADTTLHGMDWLPDAPNLAAAGFQGGPASPWAGPCYALSAALARQLREAFAAHLQTPDPTLFLPDGCPEDATLFRLIQHLKTQRVLRWPAWPACPLFQGFHYPSAPPEQLREAAAAAFPLCRRANVITWGNRGQIPGSATWQRQIRAQIMRDYRAS